VSLPKISWNLQEGCYLLTATVMTIVIVTYFNALPYQFPIESHEISEKLALKKITK
jgi:hypothetical protein